jgi:hypothetical protein
MLKNGIKNVVSLSLGCLLLSAQSYAANCGSAQLDVAPLCYKNVSGSYLAVWSIYNKQNTACTPNPMGTLTPTGSFTADNMSFLDPIPGKTTRYGCGFGWNGSGNVVLSINGKNSTLNTSNTSACTAAQEALFASDCNPSTLPVTWLYFTARANDSHEVALNWATASEINNDRFEIERSADGSSFEKIGTVNGNGNSVQTIEYSFKDTTVQGGVYYYRLKQVDFDGHFEYSTITAATIDSDLSSLKVKLASSTLVQQGNISLEIEVARDEMVEITVVDLGGRVIHQDRRSVRAGINTQELQLNTPSKGLSFITVSTGQDRQVNKVVIE